MSHDSSTETRLMTIQHYRGNILQLCGVRLRASQREVKGLDNEINSMLTKFLDFIGNGPEAGMVVVFEGRVKEFCTNPTQEKLNALTNSYK